MREERRRMEVPKNDSNSESSMNSLDTLSDVRPGRAIFILENASLTKRLVGKKRKILSSRDSKLLAKKGEKSFEDYEPNFVYQALIGILDSPLNTAGMVGGVYITTNTGILIEVKPHARLPRTCPRFCGLISDLLDKSCVRAPDTGEVLLRVLEGPVTRYIPSNARVIGLSYGSDKLVDIEQFVPTFSDDLDLVFVVGAMVSGKLSKDYYMNDYISVSRCPLTTRCCVRLIVDALMQKWKICERSFLGQ